MTIAIARQQVRALLILLSVSVTGCSTVSGWWSGSDKPEGATPLKELTETLSTKKVWSERVGSGSEGQAVHLTSALYDGRVFAASRDGEVVARDAVTGDSLWAVKTKKTLSAGPGVGEGIVVVGANDATVIALSADDGSELWRSAATSEILSLPVVSSDSVVVRTTDGAIVRLGLGDGAVLWTYEHPVPVLSLRGVGAPVLSSGRVYAGFASGKLLALDVASGNVEWVVRLTVPRGRSELDRLVDLDSDLLLSDGTIYVAGFQGDVTAVEQDSGIVLWTRKLSSFSGLDTDQANVYVTDTESNVWALDKYTGASLWKQDALMGRNLTGPVVHEKFVVVADFEGYLHWLDRDSGRERVRVRADSAGISAAPVVDDAILYALGNGGELSAFQLPVAP